MVLRQARQGPHAGKPFWGCSRYPACKAVREPELEELELDALGPADVGSIPKDVTQAPALLDAPIAPREFPVEVSAEAREAGWQCRFFQSCALPAGIVETLHMGDADRVVVRAAAQWRLDFPIPRNPHAATLDRSVLAVAESLLTRGTTPLCSVAMEEVLQVKVGPGLPLGEVLEALRAVALLPSCRLKPLHFQSAEEGSAFAYLSSLIQDNRLGWSVIAQIALASLSPHIDPKGGERGDFLLTHPDRALKPVLVEVDGEQHKERRDVDQERDRGVEAAGVQVVRVPAAEVRRGSGPALETLRRLLFAAKEQPPPETPLTRTIRWAKFLHQVQVALLMALRHGWLRTDEPWAVAVVVPELLADDRAAARLVRRAVEDLVELLERLGRVHDQPFSRPEMHVRLVAPKTTARQPRSGPAVAVLIGPADGRADAVAGSAHARLLISDVVFPREIQMPAVPAAPSRPKAPQREDVRWFLQYVFRKHDFSEGQWETIQRCLKGLDSVVLLPTGGGKSIAFQLAALLLPGRCVVVDSIISLIEDQIDNLAAVGIDRCVGITGELSTQERKWALSSWATGHYLFCYVAPERFQIKSFRDALQALTTHTPVSLVAIDEAHCVSEWGHDFRTAYLNLGRIARQYCTCNGVIPPLVALTGTASRIVLKDVQRELGITAFDAVISPKSFDRPELRYKIVRARSDEKIGRLRGMLDSLPAEFGVSRGTFFQPAGPQTHAGLVFCPHIGGSCGIMEVAEHLNEQCRAQVGTYSGEAPRGTDPKFWEARKRQLAHKFKRNQIALMVCTKAFGMGIDKPNIRYSIHISLPPSIESFYQEAGRAGRDRGSAVCAIILSNDNPRRSRTLLNPATPLDEVARAVNQTRWSEADDVVRALWFHVRAFRGVQQEVHDIAQMLDQLGEVRSRRQVNVTWRDPWWSSAGSPSSQRGASDRERAEKALHRLVVLGVVEDYTVDYASEEFGVRVAGAAPEQIAPALGRYGGAYQARLGEELERQARQLLGRPYREYVLSVAELLVRFIYEHIELARRRALSEMLQAAESAGDGEEFRRRILDYLEQSQWDDWLGAVITSRLGGLDQLGPIVDLLVSPKDAVELRAAAGRALASYPDVPGLLILRSLSEALCPDADAEVVRANAHGALRFATEQFRIEPGQLAVAWGQAIQRAVTKPGAAELLLAAVLAQIRGSPDTYHRFGRVLLAQVPPGMASAVGWVLLGRLVNKCATLLCNNSNG
jgi:ATP-dependent DNA helicase RecQ